jgi:AcrR family transcriptional regulator
MPRYSPEQREELRHRYLEAAVDLATRQGWGAVSVRNIAGIVGASASPVHREGVGSLKKQLVTWAFAELKVPLVAFMNATPIPPRETLHANVLAHLRARPESVRLLVQASAQLGLTGSDEAEAISNHVILEQQRAVSGVTRFYHRIDPSAATANCRSWAESLIRWYVAVCVTLVTDPEVTDASLLAMANCQTPDS